MIFGVPALVGLGLLAEYLFYRLTGQHVPDI